MTSHLLQIVLGGESGFGAERMQHAIHQTAARFNGAFDLLPNGRIFGSNSDFQLHTGTLE
jgi:hypothetical protein